MPAAASFGPSDTAIRVRAGEEFAIELAAAPTAGYAWRCTGENDLVSTPQESFEVESQRMGSGARQQFRFKALRTGKGELTFHYGQPWTAVTEKTHRVSISVSE